MNHTGRFLIVATLAGAISTPAVLAQSSQPAQTDQSQPNQDQYSGVSRPPPDSSIQADEDSQPAPALKPRPKPSAAIPMQPAPAPAAAPAPAPVAAAAAPASDDSDDGIVTAASIARAHAADDAAKLHARSWNPDDDIVTVVPSNPNELAEGTNIPVRLSQDLSTSQTVPGTVFRANVMYNVYKGAHVIIPAGSEMRGRVVAVSQGHHIGPHANLRLRPEVVILPDGTAYHLHAVVVQSRAHGTHTNDEGAIEASNHYKKDAIEYGAGAGTAALVGAEVAGPVGAAAGTVVGASAVTAHLLLQQPQAADLPQGSVLIFSLTEPMGLTPTKN